MRTLDSCACFASVLSPHLWPHMALRGPHSHAATGQKGTNAVELPGCPPPPPPPPPQLPLFINWRFLARFPSVIVENVSHTHRRVYLIPAHAINRFMLDAKMMVNRQIVHSMCVT